MSINYYKNFLKAALLSTSMPVFKEIQKLNRKKRARTFGVIAAASLSALSFSNQLWAGKPKPEDEAQASIAELPQVAQEKPANLPEGTPAVVGGQDLSGGALIADQMQNLMDYRLEDITDAEWLDIRRILQEVEAKREQEKQAKQAAAGETNPLAEPSPSTMGGALNEAPSEFASDSESESSSISSDSEDESDDEGQITNPKKALKKAQRKEQQRLKQEKLEQEKNQRFRSLMDVSRDINAWAVYALDENYFSIDQRKSLVDKVVQSGFLSRLLEKSSHNQSFESFYVVGANNIRPYVIQKLEEWIDHTLRQGLNVPDHYYTFYMCYGKDSTKITQCFQLFRGKKDANYLPVFFEVLSNPHAGGIVDEILNLVKYFKPNFDAISLLTAVENLKGLPAAGKIQAMINDRESAILAGEISQGSQVQGIIIPDNMKRKVYYWGLLESHVLEEIFKQSEDIFGINFLASFPQKIPALQAQMLDETDSDSESVDPDSDSDAGPNKQQDIIYQDYFPFSFEDINDENGRVGVEVFYKPSDLKEASEKLDAQITAYNATHDKKIKTPSALAVDGAGNRLFLVVKDLSERVETEPDNLALIQQSVFARQPYYHVSFHQDEQRDLRRDRTKIARVGLAEEIFFYVNETGQKQYFSILHVAKGKPVGDYFNREEFYYYLPGRPEFKKALNESKAALFNVGKQLAAFHLHHQDPDSKEKSFADKVTKTHFDLHSSNIFYDEKFDIATLIDAESLAWNLKKTTPDEEKRKKHYQVFGKMSEELNYFVNNTVVWLNSDPQVDHVQPILDSFIKGYASVFPQRQIVEVENFLQNNLQRILIRYGIPLQ